MHEKYEVEFGGGTKAWGTLSLPRPEALKLFVNIAEANGKYTPLTSVIGNDITIATLQCARTGNILDSWSSSRHGS